MEPLDNPLHQTLGPLALDCWRTIAISLTTISGYRLAAGMQIDLHGYHPRQVVWNGALTRLVEQVWQMGERELILIHGHGRNRGITPGFVNTNTGFFGLAGCGKTAVRVLLLKGPGFSRAVNCPIFNGGFSR